MGAINFKDNGEFIEVYGWNPSIGEDDFLFGALRKCEEGYYWFHPARKVVLCFGGMKEICDKLGRLNMLKRKSIK